MASTDGALARLDFFAGSTVIGTATAAPYWITWVPVPEGSYTLTAVAVDADGASTRSMPVAAAVTATADLAGLVQRIDRSHRVLVISCLLEISGAGADPATATPIATSDLGKPAPNANGERECRRPVRFLQCLGVG